MPYSKASTEDIRKFNEAGYLVVEGAIESTDLKDLESLCDAIIRDPAGSGARDWAWEEGSIDERKFRIIQAGVSRNAPEINQTRWRKWACEFAGSLMGGEVEFWYDQFLGKPPRNGAVTHWHQDEGYWGRLYADSAITCWMPFHDVTPENGCLEFVHAGHQDGILSHRQPEGMKSDLIFCDVDESRVISCPLKKGSVSFHHSKTPHMAHGNTSGGWRRTLAQHFRLKSLNLEGYPKDGHYEWAVKMQQFKGESMITRNNEKVPESI